MRTLGLLISERYKQLFGAELRALQAQLAQGGVALDLVLLPTQPKDETEVRLRPTAGESPLQGDGDWFHSACVCARLYVTRRCGRTLATAPRP